MKTPFTVIPRKTLWMVPTRKLLIMKGKLLNCLTLMVQTRRLLGTQGELLRGLTLTTLRATTRKPLGTKGQPISIIPTKGQILSLTRRGRVIDVVVRTT